MRKLYLCLVIVCSILCLTYASDSADEAQEPSDFMRRLGLISTHWKPLMTKARSIPYSIGQTYIHDQGIRGKFNAFKKVFSIRALENMTGEKVFLSGPHNDNNLDLSHDSTFGHYNPKFIEKVYELLDEALSNKTFVENFQNCYDKNFKQLFRAFYKTYPIIVWNPKLQNEYLAFIDTVKSGEAKMSASFFLQEKMRPHAEAWNDLNYYEVVSTGSFWVRRCIDQSEEEFFHLLELVVFTFDPQFPAQKKE